MGEARFAFRKHERLHKRTEFLEVYARGEKIHAPHFVLYIRQNSLLFHRLGITVSRKVGKPVVRNRVKRRLREIFRAHKEAISPGCDLVINVKRTAATSSLQKLRVDYLNAIERWRRKKGHESSGA